MADAIGALVAALRADFATALVAGERIYGGELPRGAVAGMPAGAIVIQASGGSSLTGGSDVAADTQRVDLVAYGRTPAEADTVRRAGARALLAVRRRMFFAGTDDAVLIHWVNRAGGATAARERDGQWPQSFQSLQIFHSLEGDA